MKKKILLIISLAIAATIIFNFSLVKYALTMGYHQINIVNNAIPIQEVLNDSLVHDSVKQRLLYVKKVREYAISTLKLQDSENYTEIYDQKGKAILFNLSASKKYQLKAKRWSFPIVGSFPYKGFFDLEEAKKNARELKDDWDVRIRSVGAWSTLGWFKDPILSNMLNRNDGNLAELIFHELTHSTVFIKDSIELNENLASFIGTEAAKKFLLDELNDSIAFNEYINSDLDSKLFLRHMLSGAKKLDSLYKDTVFQEYNDSLKYKTKFQHITEIVNDISKLPFKNPNKYKADRFKPNNAHFMSYRRYHEKENEFETIFKNKYESDIIRFIDAMKEKYKKE